MALERVQRTDDATSFKFTKKGDTLQGYYIKTDTITIDGREVKRHLFETDTGLISVLGQADMHKQLMDGDCVNRFVEVVFSGTVKKLKGGRTMKLYDVAVDRTKVWTGSDAADLESGDLEGIEDSDVAEEETPVDELPPARPTRPARVAATPSATSQARVQAMLSGKK